MALVGSRQISLGKSMITEPVGARAAWQIKPFKPSFAAILQIYGACWAFGKGRRFVGAEMISSHNAKRPDISAGPSH